MWVSNTVEYFSTNISGQIRLTSFNKAAQPFDLSATLRHCEPRQWEQRITTIRIAHERSVTIIKDHNFLMNTIFLLEKK